jgi:glucose/mannose transport system permease protein
MNISADHSGSWFSGLVARHKYVNWDQVYAVLTILPSIVLLAIFVYGFIGQTFLWSLTDWSGMQANAQKNYIGFDNYQNLFSDFSGFRFRLELVNTFFFTLSFVVGCLVLGFVLAVALDQKVRGESFFRTVFLFPFALSFAVTGTTWRWLLKPKGGINQLPEFLGLDAWNNTWLNDRKPYTFHWHGLSNTTLVIIIGLVLFALLRLVVQRKFLALFFTGIPLSIVLLWIWSDRLTWDTNPQPHGTFKWQNVPQYVGAAILIGFLLYVISALGQGHRRRAWQVGIPAVPLFAWYVLGGPSQFPNVIIPEVFGFNKALMGVLVASMWQLSGYTMAIYLAGIRGIPEELREAARVDGCTEWQVYSRIVLPMLRPVTLSAAIVLGHISLKIFDLIFALVGTDYLPVSVPGVQVYTTMFRSNKFAVGSSIAVVLLIIVASVIVPYLITSLRSEHEI